MKIITQFLKKSMGLSKSSSKREVYRHTSQPQETRTSSNKHSNLARKSTRKTRTLKTQS